MTSNNVLIEFNSCLKCECKHCRTTDGDVAEFHADPFIQREAPGGLVFISRIAAVRMTPVEFRVACSQEVVAMWILGIPRLTLTAGLGHTDGAAVF